MILRRLGNKSKLAKEIQQHFPPHKIYIEPFFGAGGMFFNKPKVKYNYLNDINDEVFNLFLVIKENYNKLINAIDIMPPHQSLFNRWKIETEKDLIWKAVRFLMLSNYGFMGTPNTFTVQALRMPKPIIKNNIKSVYDYIKDETFLNVCFRDLFKKIAISNEEKNKAFIYSDSPYIDADKKQNECYNIKTWNKKDVIDCMNITFNSGIKGAMSEFDNPFILQQAKERNLNVIIIGERQNLKNRRIEILITNYENQQGKLF